MTTRRTLLQALAALLPVALFSPEANAAPVARVQTKLPLLEEPIRIIKTVQLSTAISEPIRDYYLDCLIEKFIDQSVWVRVSLFDGKGSGCGGLLFPSCTSFQRDKYAVLKRALNGGITRTGESRLSIETVEIAFLVSEHNIN